ncbi:MAG: MBL fold metallo-hydrolase [Solirubrobacterales bacterium]|nr:MBL fold metallo-hydrolase [Solirubrobacterales bacterium]
MTLEGTNTYLIGREPATVLDPGPADEDHIEAVRAAAERRGGLGDVMLTHSHGDHSDGLALLGAEALSPADGERVAPDLLAIATPGHATDHFCFLWTAAGNATILFSGDLILGMGSTIVGPRELGGSLGDYMASLEKLRQYDLELILPGHGPRIEDPAAKIDEYVQHRLMRENRLLAALERGERSRALLVAEVWDDVPEQLRPAAEVAMLAHLEKLEDEARLPSDLVD